MTLLLTLLLGLGGDETLPAPGHAALRANDDGQPTIGAVLRPFYTFAPAEAGTGTADHSGTLLEDLEVWFAQWTRTLAWKVSADFAEGEAELEDAWMRVGFQGTYGLAAGQFKPRVVRSASIEDEGLFFRSRTFLGAAFDTYDDGLELAAEGERWYATLGVFDGENGSDSRHFWSLRGEWELYESDLAEAEGARGAENFLVARFGASTFGDDSVSTSEGGGLAFDLGLTYGPWSMHGEWAHLQELFARPVDVFDGHLFTLGDGDPVSFTCGRMLGEEFEAAVRYERAEDVDDTVAVRLGLSWARPHSPLRLQAEVGSVEADSRDFTIVSAGLVIGSSGPGRELSD